MRSSSGRDGGGGRREKEESAYDARVLGGAEFVTAVLREAGWESREAERRARRGLGLEGLGAAVARLSGTAVDELRSGSRRAPVVAARRALAQVAIGELGHTGSVVARYLGVATSTANRSVAGSLEPLAQSLLAAIGAR